MIAQHIVLGIALICFAISVITYPWGKPQEQDHTTTITLPEDATGKLQKGDTINISGFGEGVDQQMRIVDIKGDTLSLESIDT